MRTLYDVAKDMARQERALISMAQHNTVMFESAALPGATNPHMVIGLDFMSPTPGMKAQWALLDQAARQMIEYAHEV